MSSPLDSLDFVVQHDPKGMYGLTADFPDQCRRALEIADGAELPRWSTKPTSVLISGLGGSATGADFAKALADDQGSVSVSVNRDYGVPSWLGSGDLMLAVSYSGNTEETLSAYDAAKSQGAGIVAVTTGGQLAEKAKKDGFPVLLVPGGQPPRTALGYLLIPTLRILESLGVLPEQPLGEAIDGLGSAAKQWQVETAHHDNIAKVLATDLHGSLPLLYGLGGWQSAVAYRWKAQINENAKRMTFTHAYPELCHNELLGWIGAHKQGVATWTTVVLGDGTETLKMKTRAETIAELSGDKSETYWIEQSGPSLIETMLRLTHLGDYVSIYMAALGKEDPEDIGWINLLKDKLSKID